MTPAALADLVRAVADDVLTSRGIDPAVLPATVTVERPRRDEHGDYATGVALQVAGRAGVPPAEFARWLAEALGGAPQLRSAEVAGPGFVNLRLAPAASAQVVVDVLAEGAAYGVDPAGAGRLRGRVDRLLADAEVRVGGRPAGAAELAGLLGADTARFALVHTSGSGGGAARGAEIDVALWSTRDDRNPVYTVQYAHARLAALIRNAADLRVVPPDAGMLGELSALGHLAHREEGELIRTLGELPRIATTATEKGRPALVTRYLERLAAACLLFADACPVLPVGDEDPSPCHAARLALAQAARQVLANGMGLLGVNALERL